MGPQELIPGVTPALVEHLEARYPDRMVTDPTLPERQLWMQAGAVRLIRLLRAQLAGPDTDSILNPRGAR